MCLLIEMQRLNEASCDEAVLHNYHLLSCLPDGTIQSNQYTNALHTARTAHEFACVGWIDHYSIHSPAPPAFAVANGFAFGVDEELMDACLHCYVPVRIALLIAPSVAVETPFA